MTRERLQLASIASCSVGDTAPLFAQQDDASLRNHCWVRRRPGFTLLEVLASLLLVGIVLPMIFGGLSLIVNVSNDARKRVQATAFAESKLKELTANEMLQLESANSNSGDFGPDHPEFRWQATIADANTNSSDVTDITEIDLRVAWDSRGGERHVDLSTYVYITANAASANTRAAPATGGGL